MSAYNASGNLVPSVMENDILRVSSDLVVMDYMKKRNAPKVMYECKKLSIHGTEYKPSQYVMLPESTNDTPVFGKIHKLLSCESFGYIMYQETTSTYCSKTDIFMVSENESFAVVPCMHLPSYHTLEGYEVGEGKNMSLSLRNYIPQHH